MSRRGPRSVKFHEINSKRVLSAKPKRTIQHRKSLSRNQRSETNQNVKEHKSVEENMPIQSAQIIITQNKK